MSFKSLSQTDTVKKIVVNDSIAKEIIKDLVEGDACKEKSLLKDKEITNFENIIKLKDSIILNQSEYIDKQNKVLEIKPKPSIHLYLGSRIEKLDIEYPCFISNINLEYCRIRAGIWSLVDNNLNLEYGVSLEYKVF